MADAEHVVPVEVVIVPAAFRAALRMEMLHPEIVHLFFVVAQADGDFAIGAQAVLVFDDPLLDLPVAQAVAVVEAVPRVRRIALFIPGEPLRDLVAFAYPFHDFFLR